MDLFQQDVESFSPGNPTAASDLYGTGIRYGIYFQASGMLLSLAGGNTSSIKLTSAGLMLAILGSWTLLVTQAPGAATISRVEAHIVIMLANTLSWPAMVAMLWPSAVAGEALGIFATYIACLWSSVGRVVFWAVWHRRLPTLGTADIAFSFRPVPMEGGWFPDFALGFAVFNTTVCLGWTWPWFLVFQASINQWTGHANNNDKDSNPFKELASWTRWIAAVFGVFAMLNFSVLMVSVERTIEYNGLKPMTDLSQPGQSIPLVIGAITFLDGLLASFALCVNPERRKKWKREWRSFGSTRD